jgi:chemotaxis protein methyltransferase CheR
VAITDREFDLFRRLVHRHAGIALSEHKRQLVQARLAKRLRALGLESFTEYYTLLTEHDPHGEETTRFVNAMTTNKTNFFREPHHFDYLAREWIPAVKDRAVRRGDRSLRIWSAGCSTGEEPYTIAIVLSEGLGSLLGWDLRILASDIDTEVLERAARGTYTLEQVSAIPPDARARHFLRGRGQHDGLVQARPELRAPIAFRRINFLDDPWPIRARFDVVFCRNVLIYFDRPTQRRILERFVGLLKPDGLLFLGHSESIHGLLDGLVHLGNTIYRIAPGRAPTSAAT